MANFSLGKAVLLLFLLAIIIYSNSLGGEFVYDDEYFVVKNISIRSLGNIPTFFTDSNAVAFAELSQDVYRPITTISYAIDYAIGKMNTFGYHLVNVFMHALNAILVCLFLYVAFGDIFLAFLAAIFFACHPVNTEVVSWISGRSSVLFLFFYLASLIWYVRYCQRQKKVYFAVSLALYAFSLFSKEMALSLPLLLAAYDIHFSERDTLRKKAMRWLPYFALAAIFVVMRALVTGRVSQCGWWGGSPYYTLLTMTTVFVEYIKLLLLPANLCAFYITNISTSIADTKVLIAAGVLVAIAASLPILFKRSKTASFAVWLFFITLLPVSNIVPIRALMAERFLYLPSIGFCMLIALALQRLSTPKPGGIVRGGRAIAAILATLVVISYSIRTMARNEDWKDPVVISASIIKLYPLNSWAYTSLGAAYSGKELHAMAIKPLIKAITLSNGYFAPRNILGFSYLELGRYDDAIRVLGDALKLKPGNLEALNSLGVAYANVKKYDEARKQFEASIHIDKTFVSAYINLGATYEATGDNQKAIDMYNRVEANTRSRQDIAVAYLRMGDVYLKMKYPEKAKECYMKALGLCGRGMEQLKKIAEDRLEAIEK